MPVPGVPATEAAIIEPVACAYNGQKLAGMPHAQTALIVGCGPLGLIHVGLAKNLGVEKVAAVDPIAGRREMATRFGADLVLEPGPDAAGTLDEFSDGGIDVLVMAIGRIDALTPYLGCLAPGAAVSVFAGFGADADLAVSANDVHYNEWTIVGASSCRLDGFHAVAPMVAAGTPAGRRTDRHPAAARPAPSRLSTSPGPAPTCASASTPGPDPQPVLVLYLIVQQQRSTPR